MSSITRTGQRTQTIRLDRLPPESLATSTKWLVGAAITLAAISLGLIITRENATLLGIVGFLGALSVGLSNSGMRAGYPTSPRPAASKNTVTSMDGLMDHDALA